MFSPTVSLLRLTPVDGELGLTGMGAVLTGVSSWSASSEFLDTVNASCRLTLVAEGIAGIFATEFQGVMSTCRPCDAPAFRRSRRLSAAIP